MKCSIIVPTAFDKCEELLKPCIESIIKYTDLDETEVIVVSNGTTDDTDDYVRSLQNPHELNQNIRLVTFSKALGYPAAVNAGIEAARGEFVIPFNNDNILLEQPKNSWLDILLAPFDDPKVAITGPMKEFCPWAEMQFILFFCVMIRKAAMDAVGMLDEIFTPGIGEDTDWCCRAQIAGWKIVQVPDDNEYRFYAEKKRLGNYPIFHSGTKTFQHLGDEQDC